MDGQKAVEIDREYKQTITGGQAGKWKHTQNTIEKMQILSCHKC